MLGDMLELGKLTEEAHIDIGEKVVGVADMLVTVGPRAKCIGESAINKGFSKDKVYNFDSSKAVAVFLKETIKKGDIVLLKGSQAKNKGLG